MKALVTFAVGEHKRLLEVSQPRFEEYADRHGYELITSAPRVLTRPPSWLKVMKLLDLLHSYDEVLWVDCDVVIVDGTDDIADELWPQDWQALARHHTPDGEVPNCGVWLVRQPMRRILEKLWSLDQFRDHVWWEQAAMVHLLGYRGAPLALEQPTELYARTCWLGLEWNSHEERDRHPAPRFAHATCGPLEWRLNVMHRYADRSPTGKEAIHG